MSSWPLFDYDSSGCLNVAFWWPLKGLVLGPLPSVLIWNLFYQTFLIVRIELWVRLEPQIRSTRFAINVLFIIVTTERKVRFCVKLFHHLLTKYSSFWLEICRVSSKFCWDSSIKFQEEILFGKCSKNFMHSKALLFPDLRNLALVCNFILSLYYAEKFWKHLHKYFHMSFICRQGGTSKKKTQKKI